VDKEIVLGNNAAARQLFERMVMMKHSSKVMKALFKKYLTFETQHGNSSTQQRVKDIAQKYIEKSFI